MWKFPWGIPSKGIAMCLKEILKADCIYCTTYYACRQWTTWPLLSMSLQTSVRGEQRSLLTKVSNFTIAYLGLGCNPSVHLAISPLACSQGLPAFLVAAKSKDEEGLNSGFMIAQYTAAALGKLYI